MLKELRNFVLENDFKVTVFRDNIDILNYSEIDHFDESKIIIRFNKGVLIINGRELVILKLLNDELLINGKIEKIEFK